MKFTSRVNTTNMCISPYIGSWVDMLHEHQYDIESGRECDLKFVVIKNILAGVVSNYIN